jgi:competence protein ComEC
MQTSNPPANPFEKLNALLPLLWLSLAFLAGILLADQVQISTWTWIGLGLAAFFLALLIRLVFARRAAQPGRLTNTFLAALALAAFFFGAARMRSTIPRIDPAHVAYYNDQGVEVILTGTVADPPDERDTYTNLRINSRTLASTDGTPGIEVHGLLLARVLPGTDYHYGDMVRLRGHLDTPPSGEDFSYQDYLARQGIYSFMPTAEATLLPFRLGDPVLDALYRFKDKTVERVHRIFPEPEASLLAGILLGDDNGIPADLQQAYKNTGTAHIIAISGFNIAIIAGLFVLIFGRLLGRRKGAIAAVVGVILYTIFVGASPSVVRAAIMGSLSIFALQMGRRQNGFTTLAFTAALMAAANPNILWDVGFQLSFAATLGLVLFGPPLQDWFTGLLSRHIPSQRAAQIGGLIGAYVLFTWAAQLTTLPIIAYQFGTISLVSLLANPFILPVQPAVMVLGGLALMLSFLSLPLGITVGWLAWPFAAYTNRAVEFFNTLPHGVIVLGQFSLLFVILYYAVLLLWALPGPKLQRLVRPAFAPLALIAVLAVAVYLFWTAIFTVPDGKLHLTFLEAGSANAVLIQSPSGHTVLINGGESPSTLTGSLGRRISPFDRRLDWLVIGSPQEAQVAALPRTLDLFPPANVLWAGNTDASFSAEETSRWLAANRVEPVPAFSGAELALGDGATLKVLAVTSKGSVLLVQWEGFRALLPLGMNFDVLSTLENGKAVGPVTALLLADAGYGPSNPPEWIHNLHPQVAVLSVAAGDESGLPDASVLDDLSGVTLLRTDLNGWIEISTDGQGFWVDVERTSNEK